MSKENKKKIRAEFRDACFKRDKYSCAVCGFKSSPENAQTELDAHHITNPKEIINSGTVKQNGISLCSDCHIKAEQFHATGESYPGYSSEELYILIGSSKELAIEASKKL